MKILSILISYVLFTSCQTHKDLELARLAMVRDSLSAQNSLLTNTLRFNYLIGNDRINPEATLINEQFDTLEIGKAFTEPFTLVFYYSNFACSPCLDQELELLREESDSIPDSQLLIIGAVSSMRSIAAVIRNFHFRCRLFQLEGMKPLFDNTLFITESMFLIADKSGKVETLMAPLKNDNQSIRMFFNYVNLTYLNK